MRTAYLVGNGFDLSIGLDTSPSEFLQAFVNRYADDSEHDSAVEAASFAKDIRDEGIEKWSDFEIKAGYYSSGFGPDEARAYMSRVSTLRAFLGQWLQAEQARISDDFIATNAQECIGSLFSYRTGLRPRQRNRLQSLRNKHRNEHWNHDLVCFNYTDVLERMWHSFGGVDAVLGNLEGSTRALLGRFVYAHDSLKDKIVCGVNDPSQIANEAFRENRYVTDNLVKGAMEANVIANDLDEQARKVIEEATVVAVFGMSFGASDRRWWEQVGKKLLENQEAMLVLFDYGMIEAERGTEQIVLYERTQAAINTFASAAGVDIPREVEDRIIVAPSNLLFPIKRPLSEHEDKR